MVFNKFLPIYRQLPPHFHHPTIEGKYCWILWYWRNSLARTIKSLLPCSLPSTLVPSDQYLCNKQIDPFIIWSASIDQLSKFNKTTIGGRNDHAVDWMDDGDWSWIIYTMFKIDSLLRYGVERLCHHRFKSLYTRTLTVEIFLQRGWIIITVFTPFNTTCMWTMLTSFDLYKSSIKVQW